jgi:SAM-dependent methyltransferase
MTEVVASVPKMLLRARPILNRLPAGPCVMVEVGTGSALLAAHLLLRRRDLTLHCVDSWLAGAMQPEAYRATGDVHAELSQEHQDEIRALAMMRLAPYGDRAVVHHMDSLVAEATFEAESVDLIFLDASHAYAAVLVDCNAWWRVLKPGGWLASHDWSNADPKFRFGVNEAIEAFTVEVGLPYEVDDGNTVWIRKP